MEDSIDSEKLSGFSFASRKVPEFMSHRLVQCLVCDLVYASTPPGDDELARAYHAADYDSSEEADDAARAYLQSIRPILARVAHKESALEIGTGTGAFLDCLAEEGFKNLAGIEPSSSAIAAAPDHRRAWIRQGMFTGDEFPPNSFDLICCFMTMEHVRDPQFVARAAFKLLRPGGAFVTVTHNYRGVLNRILGRKSPIIDVEHLQLFSMQSMEYLFRQQNYQSVSAKSFANRYSFRYWLRLTPLSLSAKTGVEKALSMLGLERIKISAKVGNMMASGFKSM